MEKEDTYADDEEVYEGERAEVSADETETPDEREEAAETGETPEEAHRAGEFDDLKDGIERIENAVASIAADMAAIIERIPALMIANGAKVTDSDEDETVVVERESPDALDLRLDALEDW